MQLKTLRFEVLGINRILETGVNVDEIEMTLNAVLCNSADEFVEDYSEPIYFEWYGSSHNIQGLNAIIFVSQRPSRDEVPGIAHSEPWRGNDEPRDTIRIDGVEEESDYRHVQLSVYLPSDMWTYLYNTDLDRRKVYANATFMNNGENALQVENPSAFFFSFLSGLSFNILSSASREASDKG